MKITCDWHIHSEHSCDEAALPMPKLPVQTEQYGILDYGITDHLQTAYNLPDIKASRESYIKTNPSKRFHFGLEASVVSKWEIEEIAKRNDADFTWGIREGGLIGCELAIGITKEQVEELGIEYIIGGTHWPMYVPFEREAIIRDYHRQYMFLAEHPLIDIVAHPWWWQGYWQNEDGKFENEPWFDDFGVIPTSMHDELAAAAVQNNKAIEINAGAFLLNPLYPKKIKEQYQEYLSYMKSKGVTFSFASDCHEADYGTDFEAAANLLEAVGISDADLWRLSPRD